MGPCGRVVKATAQLILRSPLRAFIDGTKQYVARPMLGLTPFLRSKIRSDPYTTATRVGAALIAKVSKHELLVKVKSIEKPN
ncbi:hypothetical protein JG687_00014934 [Phytophthora cactorum]|uniref:Uncharacterized protein n=1 Tax=Phytophthora cactorum TaxID=29920 RepID=A0A8T1TYC7_9STRA|nr:hypothetical protein JG687_00014934 [Phytophthora cactorum]